MTVPFIGFEAEEKLDWIALTRAIEAGHSLPRAEIDDTFLYRGKDTLLSRAAWIDGLGQLVKTATIFPGNAAKNQPTINGAVSLFSDTDGTLSAMLDFALVTKWKTAGDSLLGALKLARPDSETILIVGSGTVANSLYSAYSAGFPHARFLIWSRTLAHAETFASTLENVTVAPDLAAAFGQADIVTSATMTTDPILDGAWFKPGQHIDLIGAYRPDMREANDTAITRATLFVDSRATTEGHIGEIKIPLETGLITPDAIQAEYYDLPQNTFVRPNDDAITLFKNGGGAHMDLMTSRYILDAVAG